MAIADKLTELQATKTAIKTAIENKGQDLSGVPFTEYASKIDAIQGGEAERSIKKYLEAGGKFGNSPIEDFSPFLEYSDTENLTSLYGVFSNIKTLKYIPLLNTKNVKNMSYTFNGCNALVEVPNFDLSKVEGLEHTFGSCQTLTKIPSFDLRAAYNYAGTFQNCTNLTEIWIRNILCYSTMAVGSGTTWGHLLTQESALHICKECRIAPRTKTITFATPVYDNLETLYVKLIPITDEMRTEDDLIDEKLPFELCASTDEGAMTIASYMALKNWSIAK